MKKGFTPTPISNDMKNQVFGLFDTVKDIETAMAQVKKKMSEHQKHLRLLEVQRSNLNKAINAMTGNVHATPPIKHEWERLRETQKAVEHKNG